jgi:N-acetyltransferase
MMALTFLKPTTMSGHGVTLRPMLREDTAALAMAAADGELWKLRFTSVPAPEETQAYVNKACDQMGGLERFAFTVIDPSTGQVIGSSSYHDIIPAAQRLEIGYTWYALSRQRTFVNTACKWLLLNHAFSVIGAQVVGWRTDNFNFASQKAIERLGAKRDGVIRHHAVRRDGTVRDTVMYSLTRLEWEQGVKAHLEWLLGSDK